MAYLKDDIPPDVAEVLRQAEAQADECWRALQLRHCPTDLAIWAVLTGGIRLVEGEQATRGSNTAFRCDARELKPAARYRCEMGDRSRTAASGST
jgi:hypothetical protein